MHDPAAPLDDLLAALDEALSGRSAASGATAAVRLAGHDAGWPAGDVAPLVWSEQAHRFDGDGRFERIVLAGVLHRVVNPFTLLRAIHPLLATGGSLIVSVPLRDGTGERYYPPADGEARRAYTLSSLFLELEAAWGFHAFRVRFAREYDGAAGAGAQSLVLVAEKQAGPRLFTDIPQLDLVRAGEVSNRSDEERLLSVDLGAILSPQLAPERFQRICVLKIDQIGDFAMAVPAFDEIRALFPAAEITCVCGSWNRQFAEDLGCFDRIVTCDYEKQEAERFADLVEQRAATVQRLGEELAGVAFDLAIDLRVPPDARDIILAVRARYRAAIGSAETFPYLDVALPGIDAFHAGIRFDHEASRTFFPVDAFGYRNTAASPPEVRLLQPRSGEGEFIYGPYSPLGRGAYRATWKLSSIADPVRVSFDVALPDAVRNSADAIAERVIEIHRDGPRGGLDFELHADVPRIEFRARLAAGQSDATLLFAGVHVDLISGRPPIRHMPKAQVHMKEQLALLVALVRSRLLPPAVPEAETRRRLKVAQGAAERPFFAIAPCSTSALRDWPIEGFAALCRGLLEETGASIRLIGSAEQRPRLDALAAGLPAERIENRAGDDWAEVYRSLVQAEAVVSNNSGIGHVAALLGANVLALYSGSHQLLEWGPVGREVTTLQASLACGACGFDTLIECRHGHRCQHIVDPAAVLRSLRRIAPASFADTGL